MLIDKTENPSGNTPFADRYPLPDNPLQFELELRERYAEQLPELLPLLERAINDIQNVTGMNTPKYGVDEADQAEAQAAGVADGLGHFNLPPPSWSSLEVYSPKKPSDEELANMTDTEREVAHEHEVKRIVIGDMPPEAVTLLEDIFKLAGAEVVRDDHVDGEDPGMILREGRYMGATFFIHERYDDEDFSYSSAYDLPTHSFAVCSQREGEEIKARITNTERQEFIKLSGINPYDSTDIVITHGVTRANYKDVASVLAQTREAVDGPVQSDRGRAHKALGVMKQVVKTGRDKH